MEGDKNLILSRARASVTHQLIGGVAFALTAVMIFNTLGFVQAANSDTSELNLTISAGSLELVNVGATVIFASATEGTATNVYQNLNGTTVRDFRDTANYEWDLKMYSAPMIGGTDSNYTIANTSIKVWPGNATFTNIQTFDNVNCIGSGTNNTALDSDFLIYNANEDNSGVVQIDDLGIRVTTDGTEIDQIYSGNATLTVIAG